MSGGSDGGEAADSKVHHGFCTSIRFHSPSCRKPSLDHRFKWSTVPLSGVAGWRRAVAIGFCLNFCACIERIRSPQQLSKLPRTRGHFTGPRSAIVRHPMYAGGALYLLGTPLALGSYWGLVPLAAMMPFLLWRLFDEEHFLARNLQGYAEYQKRVRHRLVPFVW